MNSILLLKTFLLQTSLMLTWRVEMQHCSLQLPGTSQSPPKTAQDLVQESNEVVQTRDLPLRVLVCATAPPHLYAMTPVKSIVVKAAGRSSSQQKTCKTSSTRSVIKSSYFEPPVSYPKMQSAKSTKKRSQPQSRRLLKVSPPVWCCYGFSQKAPF